MKKYKVIKNYVPVHGVIVETGSVVYLSERRGVSGVTRKMLEPTVEEKAKTKKRLKKNNDKND